MRRLTLPLKRLRAQLAPSAGWGKVPLPQPPTDAPPHRGVTHRGLAAAPLGARAAIL